MQIEPPEDKEFLEKLAEMRFTAACAALRKMEASGSADLYVRQAYRVADRMLVELFGEQVTGIPLRESVDAIAIIKQCKSPVIDVDRDTLNYLAGYDQAKVDAIEAIATAATKRREE